MRDRDRRRARSGAAGSRRRAAAAWSRRAARWGGAASRSPRAAAASSRRGAAPRRTRPRGSGGGRTRGRCSASWPTVVRENRPPSQRDRPMLDRRAGMLSLAFASGTIEVKEAPAGVALPPCCAWDERTRCHRAAAVDYAEIVRALVRAKVPYEDAARRYEELPEGARVRREPRP